MDWNKIAVEAWDHPGWREAAADYHRLRDGRASVVEQSSSDRWLAKHQAERQARVVALERVLLAICVHGPSSIYEPKNARFVRWAKKNWQHAYQQIVAAEREEWLRRQTPKVHKAGCACWNCLLGLHSEVAKHQAKMQVRLVRRQPLTT
jgi:hypothetical protein